MPRRFEPRPHAGGKQGLDLGGEDKGTGSIVTPVVKRLYAEVVPRQEQPAAAVVPQGDGKDAVQLAEPAGGGVGIAVVEVEEDLGVGVGAKGPSLPAELLPDLIYKLSLAIDEIATNAISHGYEESETSGELSLSAEIDAATLTIVLEDTAPPFDPLTEAEPDNLDQPLEQREAGGLGVFLAVQNVDEFAYRYANGRNCYTFTMNRPVTTSTVSASTAAVDTAQVAAILAKVGLFSELPDEVLNEIVRLAKIEQAPKDTVVFEKGDPGTKLYAILSGRVRVHDEQQTLAYLGQGEIFGEMAAIDTQPRSASVTTEQDASLLCLEQEQLLGLMRRQPEVSLGIMRALSRRFRGQVRDLHEVRRRLGRVILPLDEALAGEAGVEELLERIVVEAQQFCNADGGALFLPAGGNHLRFVILRIDSLKLALGGDGKPPADLDPLPLLNEETGQEDDRSVATYAVNAGRSVHVADVYQAKESRFADRVGQNE